MKIGDKIILLEDYKLEQYDLRVFVKHAYFKRNDIFTVNEIVSSSQAMFNEIAYIVLIRDNDKFNYKIYPAELLSFVKCDKKSLRKLKLKQLNELQ